VYVNDVSGVVKNWIDRLAHICHRPGFPDKCAYLIATVGDGPANHALKTLRMALSCWGFHIVGQSGFKMGALMKPKEVQSRFASRADEIAHTLFEAIRHRAYAKPTFISLMTFRIQQRVWQRAVADSLDLTYWKSRGWTEAEREFYIPHRANRVKVGCARIAGAFIARLVT
jgi:multimeric flavodoxin WrbA